jgi:creatinine amidohydrolase
VTVLIEEMAWPQVEQAVAEGKTTVLLACGAVEQHGPHLPIGTDAYLGTAIAERAALLAGNALVAPTLRPGLSDHHMSFPGSLTLRPETFIALLTDYCTSLAKHGFERIVIFPSHGGNADMMKAHLPWLARALADQCEVVLSSRLDDGMVRIGEYLADRGVTIGRAGVHAGYSETAMMLAHAPELVQMDQAAPGLTDEAFYAPDQVRRSQMSSFLYGIRSQSANGVLGDPSGANAEIGEHLLQMAAESLVQDVTVSPELSSGQKVVEPVVRPDVARRRMG